jgi:hypothetical protein
MLVPITAEHGALAFNQWCTIHASLDSPLAVAEAQRDGLVAVRTVCGSDVFPYLVTVMPAERPMLMAWPPPPAQRCVDCARILGTSTRRPRHGYDTWDSLYSNV